MVLGAGLLCGHAETAAAETLPGALAKAYENNASLNAARAGVRVADEGVAIAKSGWRPTINGSATFTYSSTDTGNTVFRTSAGTIGITLNQSIFDGFQTRNNVAAAKSQVLAARENLRNTTQNILFNAAAAYMDVVQTRQIAALREKNLGFLDEQLRASRVRLEVGEGTRTDVAQAEAARASAIAQLNLARGNAASAEAIYIQLIGTAPGKLAAANALRDIPANLDDALGMAQKQHPAILASLYAVDAQSFGVKSAEGALLPQLSGNAAVQANDTFTSGGFTPGVSTSKRASVGLSLNVPIYQGGRASAGIRQEKERLGQARINVDVARDQVRAQLAQAIASYTSAQAGALANQQLLNAASIALNGVVEERRVGQRTTLDVLNSQADVINAQIALAQAQAQLVTASYGVMSATGRLTPDRLGLKVRKHDPEEHYNAVKDMWFGLRTPDGR
jgi:outer membrane protein